MSKKNKIIIAAIIAILLCSYIGFAIWNVSHTQVDTGIPKNAIPVEIENSHIETIICKINVKGTVELIKSETLFSRTSATVEMVYVKEGDQVTAGQLVAEYDSKVLENLQDQLAEAKLSLKSATLNLKAAQTALAGQDKRKLENAGIAYDKAKLLYEAGAITKQEFENANEAKIDAQEQLDNNLSHISILQVTIEQNELKTSQIEKEIENYTLLEYAPCSGTVLASYIKKGDLVVPGHQLFDIADTSLNNLTITAVVPENEAKNLALSQDVEIRCTAIGQTIFKGRVSKISSIATKKQIGNSQETALTVEIRCEDAPLKAGYTIDATIITKIIENTVVIPLMSTMRDADSHSYVYIMHEDYSVEKRLVELGEYAGIYVEAGNIAEGERTIINPSAQVKEGVFVKPVAIRKPEN
ncbi:MAG: efflux RND transporter periplasmic adaptor subunit [Firmicutes bacterium]|nr:efflux RND transporter periplasmic adaptor subunit [Bacillota bacterium]